MEWAATEAKSGASQMLIRDDVRRVILQETCRSGEVCHKAGFFSGCGSSVHYSRELK